MGFFLPRKPWLKAVTLAAMAAVALWMLPDAGANHGDLHVTCDGDIATVWERPPGTEHVTVYCRDGEPEFMVGHPEGPAINPLRQAIPVSPEDFGGWVTVTLNGRPLKIPYDPSRGVWEPGPYVAASTGRVLIPVRFFTEAFGGQVQWWSGARRARLTLPDRPRPITLWLDEDQALLGARQVDIDQKPVLYRNRMFVPVRFLVESFGGKVEWNHAARTVHIVLDGLSCESAAYCGEVDDP